VGLPFGGVKGQFDFPLGFRDLARRILDCPKEASPRTAEVVAGLVGDVAVG
jgi:hypothetical protein